MTKAAFDNDKYLQMQSAHIRERIAQFGGKLYLEFGGKLYDDNHASDVYKRQDVISTAGSVTAFSRCASAEATLSAGFRRMLDTIFASGGITFRAELPSI